MTPKRRVVGLFVSAFLVWASVPVNAAIVQITVDGLPGGLQVSERGEFKLCDLSGHIISTTSAGAVPLQEHTTYTIGQAPSIGGLGSPAASFLLVPHAVYSGDLTVTLPGTTTCSADVAKSLKLFLDVQGEDANGNQKSREAVAGSVSIESNGVSKQAHLTAQASTDSIFEGAAPPTTLQKDTIHRLAVVYSDTFGGSSIKTPSLAFTQQGTVPLLGTGIGRRVSLTRARMTVTDDNQICLLVAGENRCKPLAQGGTLVNGAVTVEVGETKPELPVDTVRVVTWAFRLSSAFPSGSFTLVATANDADLFQYLIGGGPLDPSQPLQPRSIDLLPWKSLSIPITVP